MELEKQEEKIAMKDVLVVRQNLKSADAFPDRVMYNADMYFDYLTIFSESGEILSRSIGYKEDQEINLFYKGLQFISRPGYTEDKISIGWTSLLAFVNSE